MIDGPADWQRLADASFFYLHSSTRAASLASTGVFGLAYAPDYHYYRGHVMWDVESFALPAARPDRPRRRAGAPPLPEPDGAGRPRRTPPSTATPGCSTRGRPTSTAAEAVTRAGARPTRTTSRSMSGSPSPYVAVTGDRLFARQEALPVIAGIAEWLLSRVEPTERG